MGKAQVIAKPDVGGPVIKSVGLVRNMGFWQIWAVGVGSVVGDGVFLYMADGIQYGGPSAMIGFFAAGVIQMLLMVAMGEISVGMPSAGAMSVWVETYLGKFFGLLSGLTFSVGWVVLGGSISVALGRFTSYWFPAMDLEFGTVFWAAVFFTVFVIMNIAGTAIAGKGQLILVAILVAIMIVFGVVGVLKGLDMENFTPFMPNGFGGMSAVIPIATYAYLGAACLCTSGSECRKPTDLGRALVWSSITFIAVYTLALFVVLGTINWQDASMDVSPFTAAADVIFGPVGAHILNVAAWLAAATCLIMGTIYTPSRIFYAMALEGYLPKLFAKLNPKTKTPVAGIVIIWIVGIIGILVAFYYGATDFYVTLCNQAVIAWTISWGLAVIAGMKYRQKMGADRIRREVGWKQPFYPVIPILALAGCVYVLYLSFYDIWQFLGFVIWVAVYLVYYACIRNKIKKGLIKSDVQF
ncbi:MAG: amino acid permease [Clostridiales Family XIII bacterium]|jgi:amino acid transporter|nr:amino acid permease [Clostridiales Family XIII bacterium]